MAKYFAYNCGKMNQSFILTSENYTSYLEANLIKFRLFGACDYEFINRSNGEKTIRKVGKTITKNQGIGGFNATTASYFKLDGVNIFKVLDSKGYYFRTELKLDIFHPELTLVDQNNVVVATYKMNVVGPRQENVKGIGNKQRNIEITTESDDLEAVFLGAFALSRVDFSTQLL